MRRRWWSCQSAWTSKRAGRSSVATYSAAVCSVSLFERLPEHEREVAGRRVPSGSRMDSVMVHVLAGGSRTFAELYRGDTI